MSLKSYCMENNRLHILQEWDQEKNQPLTPGAVALRKRAYLMYPKSEAVPEAPPDVPNAVKKSWQQNGSTVWNKRIKAIRNKGDWVAEYTEARLSGESLPSVDFNF